MYYLVVEPKDSNGTVIDLISDDVVKSILTVTDQQAMSAQTLEAHCDASLATVYRRIDELVEKGLLRERVELQSDGNHYRVFEPNLERLSLYLDDGELKIDVDRRDDAPDRLRTIWNAMQPRWK